MTLISTSQDSEELKYAPTWPSRQLLQSHTSVISHNTEHTSSSQLVISVKSTLVDNPNVIKEGYARQHDKSVPA